MGERTGQDRRGRADIDKEWRYIKMVIKLNREIKRRPESQKRLKLNKDIREIIDKKIELSELKDFPFPTKYTASIRDNLMASINMVEREIANEQDVHSFTIHLSEVINFSINKDAEGGNHIIIRFKPDDFDNHMKEAKRKTREFIDRYIAERFGEIATCLEDDIEILDEIIGEAETAFQLDKDGLSIPKKKTVKVYISKGDMESLNAISDFLKLIRENRYTR